MKFLTFAQPKTLLRLSDLALLLVAVVWGCSYGVAKGALAFYPVLGFLAVRFILTWLLLLPTFLRATRLQKRHALRAGLSTGLLLFGIFVCETYGVAQTQASNAAFLISLCVVFTPFVEWWVLGRRPVRALFVFAGISLLGAALLSGSLTARPGVTSGFVFGFDINIGFGFGDGLMLAAALLRAITVCQTTKLTQGSQAPALALTVVQTGVVGFACLLLACFMPGGLPPLPSLPQSGAFWWATLYLVLGCTVFAFFAQNWALKHTSPSRVSLLTSSEPAFGALFAVLWLGESLSTTAWLGGGLIVVAALWTTARRANPRPSAIVTQVKAGSQALPGTAFGSLTMQSRGQGVEN